MTDHEAIEEECAHLRARVVELERAVHNHRSKAEEREAVLAAERAAHAEAKEEIAELRRLRILFQGLLDASPALYFVKDLEWKHAVSNKAFDDFFQVPHGHSLGKTDHELFPKEMADDIRAFDNRVLDHGATVETEDVVRYRDEVRTYHTVKFPIRDEGGAIVGLGVIATNITERRQLEAKRSALEAHIDTQRATLHELSTPLIPLSSSVVLLPLIGTIDSQRARQVMETLLDGIGKYRARIVILDITGVRVIDREVANALIQSAQAARLLGAEVVLTGIQPHLAQILVELGINLGAIVTRGTLEGGIAYAMNGALKAR